MPSARLRTRAQNCCACSPLDDARLTHYNTRVRGAGGYDSASGSISGAIFSPSTVLLPPSHRPAARPRRLCLAGGTTAAASFLASGSMTAALISRPPSSRPAARPLPPPSWLADRWPPPSSLRQRRHSSSLRLGQRLRRSWLDRRRRRLGQRLDPPPPPSWPEARSAALASPRSANAADFISTNGSTATASISASGSMTVSGATATTFASAGSSTAPPSPHQRLDRRHLRLGQWLDLPPLPRPEARPLPTSSRPTARPRPPPSRPAARISTNVDRRLLHLGQRLDDRQRCDCHHLCFGRQLNRPAVASPAARLPPSSSWPAARSPQPSPHPAADFIPTSSSTAAAFVLASGSMTAAIIFLSVA